MIRTQVQIEEDQMEWLKSQAKEKNVSISKLFRESVEIYRKLITEVPTDKKKRVMKMIGRFSSGKKDVSEKHDNYLADAFEEMNDDAK